MSVWEVSMSGNCGSIRAKIADIGQPGGHGMYVLTGSDKVSAVVHPRESASYKEFSFPGTNVVPTL